MSEVKINPLMISAGPSGVTDLERLQATCNGLDAQNDALALENGALREQLDAQRLRADTAEAELKKLHSEHFKEAVACVFDNLKIVACNTDDRAWDDRLEDLAEDVIEMAPEYKKEWKDIGDLCRKLAAAEQGIAERDELIADVLKAFNLDIEGRGSCTNPGIAFIRPWADRVAALNPNPEAESHE